MQMSDKELQEIRESATEARRMRGSFIDTQEYANDCERLLSTIEALRAEVERIKLDSNDRQDEYEMLKRRYDELNASALESLELFQEASKDVVALRTEAERYREALEEAQYYLSREATMTAENVIDKALERTETNEPK